MPKQITAEQVLKAIYEVRADAFSDSRRLSALFADYSGGRLKAQQNQLDIFLKCDGNTCILNLRNAPKQKQQTEYHRLIQEMVRDYGMQDTVAQGICDTFWHVVHGTPVPYNGLQTQSFQLGPERTQKTTSPFTKKPKAPIERPTFDISP